MPAWGSKSETAWKNVCVAFQFQLAFLPVFQMRKNVNFLKNIIQFGCRKFRKQKNGLIQKPVLVDCTKESGKVSPLCNGDETQELWKPLLTQFSLSEAHRNVLHNETFPLSFVQAADTT